MKHHKQPTKVSSCSLRWLLLYIKYDICLLISSMSKISNASLYIGIVFHPNPSEGVLGYTFLNVQYSINTCYTCKCSSHLYLELFDI